MCSNRKMEPNEPGTTARMIARLGALAAAAESEFDKDAIIAGMKALARKAQHKIRNKAARKARAAAAAAAKAPANAEAERAWR